MMCFAVCIIFFFEGCTWRLSPFISDIYILFITKSAQIVFLILLLSIETGKPELSLWQLGAGLKTGLFWTFFFGIVVLLSGFTVFLIGIDPIAIIRPTIPVSSNTHLFLITAILIGPIAEELFFRGFLYSFLRPSGTLTAVSLTTVLFAFSHYSGAGIPFPQLIGGGLFAFSFEDSKNIVTPITIHILGNLAIYGTVIL